MTLTAQIKDTIIRIPEGKTFRYSDLPIEKKEFVSAAKVLERLQKDSSIKKLSKGVFYKPKKTLFGELKPDYTEQLNLVLFDGDKRIGYETGLGLYNRLGLTTQVAFRTKVATTVRKNSINRELIKVDFVKSYNLITEENYQLLGLLDAIKDIKDIPDTTISNSIIILKNIIKDLSQKELVQMVDCSLTYPPRVRALLGAILEEINTTQLLLDRIKASLNPFTKIFISISEDSCPTIKTWNIQ